ncbi:MAG: HDOD domain-containing protein [Desulfarculus sp.]|nr:HDOD domain-containing protein [Desulfarculus sp.]
MAPDLPQRIERLPSLPTVLSNLLAALDNETTSTQDIEHILEQDQSTTSKLLSVANSAYYGLRHQVTSISRAVMVLGLDEVRSICLGTVLASMLGPRAFADEESARQLWRHSLATQQAARLLAERSGAVNKSVALTTGLLHDLGWVVLMAYRPELWERLRQGVDQEGLSLEQAEAGLSFSHQEAGLALAKHWDLPPLLARVMGHHHQPQASLPHAAEVGLTHLADGLAGELGQGPWAWPAPAACPGWLLGVLGLDQERVEACRQELLAKAGELEALWSALLDG